MRESHYINFNEIRGQIWLLFRRHRNITERERDKKGFFSENQKKTNKKEFEIFVFDVVVNGFA